MSRVRMIPGAVEALAKSAETWQALEVVANAVAERVDAPSHLRVWVKRGDGPRGPFAQVIMEGPGALAEEFGTRSRPPKAPIRKALRGGR
ncbi:MAG: hypothetical protein M0R75_14015 [Dehalococcoidia bacterium]|nr:hypothetical protein [Dehalococcoidia bacterium]